MVVRPSVFVYVRYMPADQIEVPETSTTPPPEVAAPPQRVAYTPFEFAQITGMKPNHVRRSIRSGDIKATKVGGIYFISRLEVERLFGIAA